MKKILVIEDDKIKIEKLTIFLNKFSFAIKESYHTGLAELKQNIDTYGFLILDMTIPLWEKENNKFGGSSEQFGGEEILREMKRRKLQIPTVLLTMFDVFPTSNGSITFEQISADMKRKFPEFYLGGIFYNASDDSWKIDLENFINSVQLISND